MDAWAVVLLILLGIVVVGLIVGGALWWGGCGCGRRRARRRGDGGDSDDDGGRRRRKGGKRCGACGQPKSNSGCYNPDCGECVRDTPSCSSCGGKTKYGVCTSGECDGVQPATVDSSDNICTNCGSPLTKDGECGGGCGAVNDRVTSGGMRSRKQASSSSSRSSKGNKRGSSGNKNGARRSSRRDDD